MAGYVDFSKSNNAVAAENEGRFPASTLARKLKVKTAAIKELLKPCEWHHTSSWYNTTDYYDIEDALEILSELKTWKSPDSEIIDHGICTVKYLEWGGSRRRPKATKIVEENCCVMQKDNWCTIKTSDGKSFRKNINTNGFSFKKKRRIKK